jgi:excisionase family DNA binding protein
MSKQLDNGRTWLDADEVADYLSVSRRTIYNWLASREIPTVELPGRIRRFDRDAIDDWVRSMAVPVYKNVRRR